MNGSAVSHRWMVAGAAVLALAAAGFAGWRVAMGPTIAAYTVERGDIAQSVVATGRVESPRRVEIGSSLTGTVAAVPVSEGQQVAAGAVLVKLDDAELRAALEQARFGLAQAQARLEQLHSTALPMAAEAARQAAANLDNAERALARSKELFARGFVGQAALDEAQRNRDVVASQLASARLQRASQDTGGTDTRLASAAVEAARASYDLARARLELATIEAPEGGVLISRKVEKGSVVQPGKVLMVLAPNVETQLVVQIDEKNLPLISVGQGALASADAYPGQQFPARVAYINPGVDPSRGSVEVKLAVAQAPAYLLQDMTVSVDIEAARRSGVLTLPADALRPGDWVLAVRDGRAKRQAVKVGARGAGRIEVVEGLAEGERVVPGTRASVRDGDRLRLAAAARP